MSADDLPAWVAISASVLLVVGGLVTLIGSLGLLRLPDFFARVHGPSMGNTVGVGCVLLASMLTTSAIASRPIVHELMIAVFIVMSSPVTAMILVRAALYRNGARRKSSSGPTSDGTQQ
jgi:multicomponent K+:H+ antiporter subunit G